MNVLVINLKESSTVHIVEILKVNAHVSLMMKVIQEIIRISVRNVEKRGGSANIQTLRCRVV